MTFEGVFGVVILTFLRVCCKYLVKLFLLAQDEINKTRVFLHSEHFRKFRNKYPTRTVTKES